MYLYPFGALCGRDAIVGDSRGRLGMISDWIVHTISDQDSPNVDQVSCNLRRIQYSRTEHESGECCYELNWFGVVNET